MLLLGGSLSLCAQSKYPPIEELVYTGYYNWGFIWVKAGRVDFSLTTSEKCPHRRGKRACRTHPRKISECRTFKSCGVFFTFLGLDIHDQGHPDIAF